MEWRKLAEARTQRIAQLEAELKEAREALAISREQAAEAGVAVFREEARAEQAEAHLRAAAGKEREEAAEDWEAADGCDVIEEGEA
jgi:hypothetical protein